MEIKKCIYCGDLMPENKRSDSKFCSTSCKAKHWEAQKQVEQSGEIIGASREYKEPVNVKIGGVESLDLKQEKLGHLEGLRGVVNSLDKKTNTKSEMETSGKTSEVGDSLVVKHPEKINEAYEKALFMKLAKDDLMLRILGKIREIEKEIYYANNNNIEGRTMAGFWTGGAMLGGLVGKNNIWGAVSGGLLGLFGGHLVNKNMEAERERKRKEYINYLVGQKKSFQMEYNRVLQQWKDIVFRLVRLPKFTEQPIKTIVAKETLLLNSVNIKEENKPSLTEPQGGVMRNLPSAEKRNAAIGKQTEPNNGVITSDKLISSKTLGEMSYQCLNFQGRWEELMGQPSVVFHAAVHGKPGEGKSTFCIQMAYYLAENFGTVLYISGEEGFSKTLRDKVMSNNAVSDYLYFADVSNFEKIKELVENRFHFIFIDSLDTLKVDVSKLKALREKYPHTSFITISQATKDGKMRGSNEIVHDVDVAIKVENGIAETTKNRFNPRSKQFDVFQVMGSKEKKSDKMISPPRNLI